MRHTALTAAGRSASLRLPPLLLSSLAVGTLDFVACSLYWAARGVSPMRIAQGPAAWIIGADARTGGGWSAMLGLLVLYALALAIVAGYRWLATRDARLLRAPLRWGGAYGAFVFALLTFVLVPMSAAPNPHAANFDWLMVLLAIYVFAIGMPTALLVRWMHATR